MNLRGPGGTTFQSVRLYQMLITNGTCVSTMVKSRAGSRGSRRRHDSLNRGGLSLRRFDCEAFMAPAVAFIATWAYVCPRRSCSWAAAWHQPDTCDAICWQLLRAESMPVLPAMTAENCWVQRLPTSWNSGIPTYWTPGRPG